MSTQFFPDRVRVPSATRSTTHQRYIAAAQPECRTRVQRLLDTFGPTTLAAMDDVALQDRIDTKYVLHAQDLYRALYAVRNDYLVLDINGQRVHGYKTLYFDTNGFELYMYHHAGRRNRYKVRSRQYVDSQLSFLEIKHKTNSNRTQKQRIVTDELVTQLSDETNAFVARHLPSAHQSLEPKLWNSFSRMTLVSKYHQERLTIDIDICFGNDQRLFPVSNLAVAEVKQSGINRHSRFIQQMRSMQIHQMNFSKYCIGVSLVYDTIKHNAFKPNLRLVHSIMEG